MKRNWLILLLLLLGSLLGCTSYTTSPQYASIPTLIKIDAIATGYELVYRAGNPEIFFKGYKLYIGNTESESHDPPDILNSGYGCSVYSGQLANFGTEYSIEISTDTTNSLAAAAAGENSNRYCKIEIPTALQAGQYVTLRSLLLSIRAGTGTGGFSISPPSNTLQVP